MIKQTFKFLFLLLATTHPKKTYYKNRNLIIFLGSIVY